MRVTEYFGGKVPDILREEDGTSLWIPDNEFYRVRLVDVVKKTSKGGHAFYRQVLAVSNNIKLPNVLVRKWGFGSLDTATGHVVPKMHNPRATERDHRVYGGTQLDLFDWFRSQHRALIGETRGYSLEVLVDVHDCTQRRFAELLAFMETPPMSSMLASLGLRYNDVKPGIPTGEDYGHDFRSYSSPRIRSATRYEGAAVVDQLTPTKLGDLLSKKKHEESEKEEQSQTIQLEGWSSW